MRQFTDDKVRVTIAKIKSLSVKSVHTIPEWKYIKCDYKVGNQVPQVDDSWGTFEREQRVGGSDDHYWFYTEFRTPDISENEEIYFELTTGQEGRANARYAQTIAYLNGEAIQGLDTNHTKVYLEPNKEYKLHLYFYVGTLGFMGVYHDVRGDIRVRDKRLNKLYYDLKVPYDAAKCFDEKDYNSVKILKFLDLACNIIDFRDKGSEAFYESVVKADEYLIKEFYEKECGNSDVTVNYIGHTHIDVAWQWTLAQTREKVQRSFGTVLTLMEKYPEYLFMSSQPQLYEYLKEEDPKLYEKVKERIKEGRWEAEGAMWLEADCNLSSGESLIRQIIYGKRYMKEEFGVDNKILWLPDVFGYSVSMPQILKKCGVDKFVTSKISWSETNTLPYDSFMWQGLDGTEIYTRFLTAQNHEDYLKNINYSTYVGDVTPTMNLGTWERYQQKEYSNECIVTFGYGDGGGGPTEEMIETVRRLEYGLPGMPKAQMSFAGDFLDREEKSFQKYCDESGKIPKWVGELYLEYHRGTYTSVARNKKNNRECEFLCQDTETLSVINNLLLGEAYPQEVLYNAWKKILLNQFHDIIPGSSIHEVYVDSDADYLKVRTEVGKEKTDRFASLSANICKAGILVYNPNSFTASGYAKYGEKSIYVKNIPALGWKVIDKPADEDVVTVSDHKIENKHYAVTFDADYNIISLFDKDNNREVIKNGGKGNVICAYEDMPKQWDNWDISNYYVDKKYVLNKVESVQQIEKDGGFGFEITRKYNESVIRQYVLLYPESRRIDIKNDIDWHENQVLLKAEFDVDIHSTRASYDVQFGNTERNTHQNTSWDAAKFEVCAQKWADLSEDDYGVSILNNCKYGHSIIGDHMTITMLKCGINPSTVDDHGQHLFTYSILPHSGDFKVGGTINEANLLNRPLIAFDTVGGGKLPDTYSLVECDKGNILVETVKQSENGDGIVVRLHDEWNRKSQPTLKFGFDANKVYLTDMLENVIEEIPATDNTVKLNVSNFEIVTLLVK